MRATARALSFFDDLLPAKMPSPSWYSGRIWLFKLGYYKLMMSRERHDDWLWVVDHATQWGKEKCFVILGIRMSQVPQNKILALSDVVPLLILPMSKSTGDIIYKELVNLTNIVGIPKAIIADEGSDLKLGLNTYSSYTNGTVYLHDIKHLVTNVLKNTLEKDKSWELFIKEASECRNLIQQTSIAGLAPPNQRSKARYMNVDILIKWAYKILPYLEIGDYPESVDRELILEKLGWVYFYADDLRRWKCILDIAETTEEYIRVKGYKIGIAEALDNEINPLTYSCTAGKQFKDLLLNKIFQQESKIKSREDIFLSSSEVIESLFGKFKNFQSEQAKSGFTVSTLALAAMVGKTDAVTIKESLETVTVQHIQDWKNENIKVSVQAQRVMWLGSSKKEQKRYEKLAA